MPPPSYAAAAMGFAILNSLASSTRTSLPTAKPGRFGRATHLIALTALAGALGCSERAGFIESEANPPTSNTEQCVGIDPGDEIRANPEQSAAHVPVEVDPDDPEAEPEPLEVPDALPLWRLEDYQPQSCGYEATYGADTFEGNVVVLALLQGWCGYCQSQALELDKMRLELASEGYDDVAFLAVNGTSANTDEYKKALTDRCAFPLFQDTETINAWALHGGKKDDIFIYDAEGNLAASFTEAMEVNFTLSSDEGFANVKNAILGVLE